MTAINLGTFDLTQLPSAEDDQFEFKSSTIPVTNLEKKLTVAASGFGNSGGGCLVAGVDASGNADGGIPVRIGRQNLRDWADQAVHQVEPTPAYDIKLIDDPAGRGSIDAGSAVLVVSIKESHAGPHMAPDHRYYIRAGAHTAPARHFIVDAVWAKRHLSKPRLTHVLRAKPDHPEAIQLGIVALTDSPALNVQIQISPLPELMAGCDNDFPLQIPVVDRQNPFFLDVATHCQCEQRFGKNVQLRVAYRDLAGNAYTYETAIEIRRSIGPLRIGAHANERMARALESIQKLLAKDPR